MQDKSVEFNAVMGSLVAQALVELLVERKVISTTDAATIYAEVQKSAEQLRALDVQAGAQVQKRLYEKRSKDN